jgi:hypothetical protein
MIYAPKAYTYIQFIAYECPTLDYTQPGEATSTPLAPPVRYLQGNDEKIRVQRFLDVLNWARNNISSTILGDNNTLKIFMAPEFYFKSYGGQNGLDARYGGSYTFNTMINILDCLRNLFTDPTLSDWLIVAGSVVSNLPADAKVFIDNPEERAYLNTTAVVKGGHPKAPFHFVHKKQLSDIDGPPTTRRNELGEKVGTSASENEFYAPFLESWQERKQRIFTVDNITFGLEVCLDHARTELKKVCKDYHAQEGKAAPPIDIHLITSCGMQIRPESVAARPDGYVMINDGKPENRVYSAVQKITKQHRIKATLDLAMKPAWTGNVPEEHQIPQPAWYFSQRILCYDCLPI